MIKLHQRCSPVVSYSIGSSNFEIERFSDGDWFTENGLHKQSQAGVFESFKVTAKQFGITRDGNFEGKFTFLIEAAHGTEDSIESKRTIRKNKSSFDLCNVMTGVMIDVLTSC